MFEHHTSIIEQFYRFFAAPYPSCMATINIILPCYNPHHNWMDKVITSSMNIKKQLHGDNLRIVLVNDGSVSGISNSEIQFLREKIPFLTYCDYETNRGKGFAIRKGIEHSNAEHYIFTDIDFPFADESIIQMAQSLKAGKADVVIGVRDEDYYTHVPPSRRFVSRLLKKMTAALIRIPVPDTQCGLKGFNLSGKDIFMQTTIDRYLFDMEFIYLVARNGSVRYSTQVVKTDPNSVFSRLNFKTLFFEGLNFVKMMLKR